MDSEPPTEKLTPKVTEAQIVQLLKDQYKLTVLTMKPLVGYDDINFHAQMDTNNENPYIDRILSLGYVVKISNIDESNCPETLYTQFSAMKHLAEKGIPCQHLVKNVDGDELTDCVYKGDDGTNIVYKMSVREFLPGKIVGSIPLTPGYLYDVGVFVARVAQALQDFDGLVCDKYHPRARWSLSNALFICKMTHVIENNERRQLCEEVLKAFEEQVIPAMADFRKGQIHGDINEQNILVSEDTETKETLEITGLIDFQSCANSFLIYELAISTCHIMTLQKLNCDRLDIPGHLLAGYMSLLKITTTELRLFRILVAARMVQSLTYGLCTYYLDPSNEYALTSGKAGWGALTMLWKTSSDVLEKRWDEIIASYKPKVI